MKFIAAGPFVLTIFVLMVAPHFAPRYTLFGVRTGAAFRASSEGRHAISQFRLYLAAALVAGLLSIVLLPPTPAFIVPPLLALGAFFGAFVHMNRRLKPFAEAPALPAPEVDLLASDRMPRTKWLSILPLAMFCGTAVYLQQNWSRIPERFPIHWGLDGQPNGWATRTPLGVYGILIFCGALLLWLIILNAALWTGVRRSSSRRFLFNLLLISQFTLALAPCYAALSPLFKPSPLPILALAFGPLIVIILYVANQTAKPADPGDDRTPDNAWSGGLLYFNRDDPSLAVPRRDGIGYTPNLARPMSWLLFAGPVAIALLGAWLLR